MKTVLILLLALSLLMGCSGGHSCKDEAKVDSLSVKKDSLSTVVDTLKVDSVKTDTTYKK